MKLSVNLDTHIVTPSPSPLRIKAGSKIPCEVSFTRNSRTVTLDSPVVEFAVKPTGAFDTDLLIFHNAFEAAANSTYLATINSDTVNLRNALGLGDENTATDKPQIDGSGEVAWTVGGETFRSATFPVTIEAPIANSLSQPLPAAPAYPAPEELELIVRKGQSNGYAALDGNAKVPSSQLPVETWAQSVNGRTGQVILAKGDVGLGNVDNTRDADKPISTATQTALAGKAASTHTHPASQISDSTAAGRALLTAADAAAQRTSLGAVANGGGIAAIVALTQAQYNALTPSATTLYVITG